MSAVVKCLNAAGISCSTEDAIVRLRVEASTNWKDYIEIISYNCSSTSSAVNDDQLKYHFLMKNLNDYIEKKGLNINFRDVMFNLIVKTFALQITLFRYTNDISKFSISTLETELKEGSQATQIHIIMHSDNHFDALLLTPSTIVIEKL